MRVLTDEHVSPVIANTTNLPREWFLPTDIATMYRCRWSVELLFRELKTLYELDEFDTTNPTVVEIRLYAAVLTLLVSRELLELVIKCADDEAVFPPERWVCDQKVAAQQIHQQRPILQERFATAIQPTAGVS